jgi:predicted nucleic acid-binding protein
MNAVFADSYYFLALLNRRDQAHKQCLTYSQSSIQPVMTTDWVLMEVGDALRHGPDRAAFMALLQDLEDDPDSTVVPADQGLLDQAIELFGSRPDKEWSLTDCTSFVVMQQNGLTQALTADHHFEQAGFSPLFTIRP